MIDWGSRYPSSNLFAFDFGASLLKLKSRKKGTLVIYGFRV